MLFNKFLVKILGNGLFNNSLYLVFPFIRMPQTSPPSSEFVSLLTEHQADLWA